MADAKFAALTVFRAQDRVSGTFKTMGKNADRFGNRADKAFKKAGRSARSFKDITRGILAAQVINKAVAAASQGVRVATSEFIDFDQAITAASAKFQGLNLATKEGQKTLKELGDTARRVGATTQFSAAEAASGLDFLALAGFDAEQAMASLDGTVALATVANIDLGRATDIATDSLGAFGLMTKDSVQLQKNLTRVNDVMAKTMATSNTSLEQMFEAVAAGAADFTTAGQSMESFSALVGTMANAGKKGESAGTALRNIMVRLSAPVGAASKILRRFGVTTKDQAGNFRDVVDILGDFDKGMKGLGTAQKTAAISTVFGLRAQGAINILMKAGTKNIKEYRDSLLDASGASQKMADIMRGSILNRLKSMRSALIEITFKVFKNFEKRGVSSIDSITESIRKFDVQPIITGIETAIDVFKKLKEFISGFSDTIFIAATAWTTYMLATKAVAFWHGVTAVAAFAALAFEIGIATTAMTFLNAAFIANPIGAVITGLALAAAGSIWLVKNWDSVITAISNSGPWQFLMLAIQGVIELLNRIPGVDIDVDIGSIEAFKRATAGSIGVKAVPEVSAKERNASIQHAAFAVPKIAPIETNITAPLKDRNEAIKSGSFGVLKKDQTRSEPKKRAPVAPNKEEANSRGNLNLRSTVDLNFNNAPENMTFATRNAPDINVNGLGTQ